jgi:hypothetical protein
MINLRLSLPPVPPSHHAIAHRPRSKPPGARAKRSHRAGASGGENVEVPVFVGCMKRTILDRSSWPDGRWCVSRTLPKSPMRQRRVAVVALLRNPGPGQGFRGSRANTCQPPNEANSPPPNEATARRPRTKPAPACRVAGVDALARARRHVHHRIPAHHGRLDGLMLSRPELPEAEVIAQLAGRFQAPGLVPDWPRILAPGRVGDCIARVRLCPTGCRKRTTRRGQRPGRRGASDFFQGSVGARLVVRGDLE